MTQSVARFVTVHETTCILCGSTGNVPIFSARDNRLNTAYNAFQLVSCAQCDLVYINPSPDEQQFGLFYPPTYHTPYDPTWDKVYGLVIRKTFARITSDIKKYKERGRLLDFGCGAGGFMEYLYQQGFDVYGIDSGKAGERLSPALRSRARRGRLADCGFPEGFFDVVTMKQVLEHLADPNTVLRELRGLLKPDGILYLEVPNFHCAEARLFGRFWYNLEVPRHLYQFSRTTLIRLLQKNGFEPLAVLTNSGFMILKSPLAVVHSFRYWLTDRKWLGMWSRRCVFAVSAGPLLLLTLLLRTRSWFQEGMDLRVVARPSYDGRNGDV